MTSVLCLFLALGGAAMFESDAGMKHLPPPIVHQLAKVMASDGTATCQFGFSVAGVSV